MNTIPLARTPEALWDARRSIACDVDGTLLLWPGPDPGGPKAGVQPQPNVLLVERLKRWKSGAPNRVLVVWSGMGEHHAANAVAFCGLGEFVDAILPKPTLILDDHPGWFDENAVLVDVR